MADPATAQAALYGLPVILWTGFITGVTTLIGTLGAVIATNSGNTKRLRLQLEHDTDEKAKEQLITLRRELYLKAADANVHGLAYFGHLPDVDLTKPGVDAPIQNVLAVGAQLLLVVRQETAQLISDLVSSYGELQFKALAKVLPIHNARSDIEICNGQYESTQVEIKRVLAEMANHNETGRPDPPRFQQLEASYDMTRERAQQVADERSVHWKRLIDLKRQYLKDLLPEVARISEKQVRVLVELRRELNVGGDTDVFQQMMRDQLKRAEKAIEDFDQAVSNMELE